MTDPTTDIIEFLYADADRSIPGNGLVVQNAAPDGMFWRCGVCNEQVREAHGMELGPPVTYVIEAVCPNGHPQPDDDRPDGTTP